MLKLGCILLTLWSLLNLLASLFVVFIPVVFLHKNVPALKDSIESDEIHSLSAQTVDNINSIAVFANGVNIAFSLLMLFTIWFGLYRKAEWVFWALIPSLLMVLVAASAADYVAGLLHPEINLITGVVIFAGLFCCAIGIFKKS